MQLLRDISLCSPTGLSEHCCWSRQTCLQQPNRQGRELPEAVLAEGQSGSAHRTNPFHLNGFRPGNLLVAAKAVTDLPLRGEVIITEEASPRAPSSVDRHPEQWLEARALPALDIEVGGSVFVGEAALTVSEIIITELDRTSGSMMDNAGPRLMLNMADVVATNVVQLGSRVSCDTCLPAINYLIWTNSKAGFVPRKNGAVAFTCGTCATRVRKLMHWTVLRALLLGSLFAVVWPEWQ